MTTVTGSGGSDIKQALTALRDSGIVIQNVVDDVSLAVTASRLDAGTWDKVELSLDMPKMGEGGCPEGVAPTRLRLNPRAISAVADVVRGGTSKLSDAERQCVQSLETLISKGAAFHLEEHTIDYARNRGEQLIGKTKVVVPNDKKGLAFVLMCLENRHAAHRVEEDNTTHDTHVFLAAGGNDYYLKSLGEVNSLAQNL